MISSVKISDITGQEKALYLDVFIFIQSDVYHFHLTRTENRTSPLNLPGKYKLKHQIRTT